MTLLWSEGLSHSLGPWSILNKGPRFCLIGSAVGIQYRVPHVVHSRGNPQAKVPHVVHSRGNPQAKAPHVVHSVEQPAGQGPACS